MSSSDSARRLGLLAVAAALAFAIAAAGKRLASGGSPAGGGEPETYRCACGTAYRVRGADRHRVYWREGAPDEEPVLGERCVQCDAPLPSGHDVAAV
jgi:hypothetical protein